MGAPVGNRFGAAENRGKTALQRFAEKCVFDYTTGCVLWSGGTSSGRGNSARYGVFWDDGRWFAHRWAAVHIHGIELGPNEAGHCCPAGPNTLCVQHLEGQTKTDNVIERNRRVANKGQQPALIRQMWLFRHLGIDGEEPEQNSSPISDVIPFFQPPAWLRPYIKPPEVTDDDYCPF